MKKLVSVVDVVGEGIEALLGQMVTVFSLNYIYHGKLAGVNTTDILLEDAYIIYETGSFTASEFQNAQPLAKEWRLRTATIESYGVFTSKAK